MGVRSAIGTHGRWLPRHGDAVAGGHCDRAVRAALQAAGADGDPPAPGRRPRRRRGAAGRSVRLGPAGRWSPLRHRLSAADPRFVGGKLAARLRSTGNAAPAPQPGRRDGAASPPWEYLFDDSRARNSSPSRCTRPWCAISRARARSCRTPLCRRCACSSSSQVLKAIRRWRSAGNGASCWTRSTIWPRTTGWCSNACPSLPCSICSAGSARTNITSCTSWASASMIRRRRKASSCWRMRWGAGVR